MPETRYTMLVTYRVAIAFLAALSAACLYAAGFLYAVRQGWPYTMDARTLAEVIVPSLICLCCWVGWNRGAYRLTGLCVSAAYFVWCLYALIVEKGAQPAATDMDLGPGILFAVAFWISAALCLVGFIVIAMIRLGD